jgi:hypothetical protein
MIIEGPEMRSTKPSMPSGMKKPRPKKEFMTSPSAVVMPPTATPRAATTPTSTLGLTAGA